MFMLLLISEKSMLHKRIDKMRKNTVLTIGDWRKALRAPHVYRVANSTFRIQSQFLTLIVVIVGLVLFLLALPLLHGYVCTSSGQESFSSHRFYTYNKTYPLTTPIRTSRGTTFRIAIVSDLDTDSKSPDKPNIWQSIMKVGSLFWNPSNNFLSVMWDERTITLSSSLALKGRGMELSELVTFDGRLLSFDDRTGAVYIIEGEQAYPWLILMDGNGKTTKGFKSEWATVKDGLLYIGSMGKEWTTAAGEFVHHNPQWVKVVSPQGEVQSFNWISNFNQLRKAIDIEYPGYMIHESGVWSDVHRKWFFLPRRCSRERYNETKDETTSCNVLLTADENFTNIKATVLGPLDPIRGFSSFKFLPDSHDSIIVALKTKEYQGHTATYITAFTLDGTVIMPESKVMDKKFEGLEFV